MRPESFRGRIENRWRILLQGVALEAGVHQIVVVTETFRMGRLWQHMIDAKQMVTVGTPAFTP
jgi:hypothetical protein